MRAMASGGVWVRVAFLVVGSLAVLAAACGPSNSEPATAAAQVREAAATGQLTDEQQAQLDQLEALGYASGTEEAGSESGVTIHQPERASSGWNLVVSGHAPVALLMDMQGRELHRWSRTTREVWPDRDLQDARPGQHYFRRAHLLENGDLLVIFEGLGLVKLDKHSEVQWAFDGQAHHDLEVGPAGHIYVLTRQARMRRGAQAGEPLLEDFVTVLEADGTQVESVSLLECFRNSPFAGELERAERSGDIFHTNTLELLDGRHAELSPAFARGNFLISLRELDLLAVVDLEGRTIRWSRRGSWKRQHQPVLLDSGNMLLFDNKGTPGHSQVLELAPLTGEVVWSYPDDAGTPFYSATCGASQRLPNGNTLITESRPGRAFEVTPDKAIVWEYFNPYRTPDDESLVATLFEVVRLPADWLTDWLD